MSFVDLAVGVHFGGLPTLCQGYFDIVGTQYVPGVRIVGSLSLSQLYDAMSSTPEILASLEETPSTFSSL